MKEIEEVGETFGINCTTCKKVNLVNIRAVEIINKLIKEGKLLDKEKGLVLLDNLFMCECATHGKDSKLSHDFKHIEECKSYIEETKDKIIKDMGWSILNGVYLGVTICKKCKNKEQPMDFIIRSNGREKDSEVYDTNINLKCRNCGYVEFW